MPYKYIGKTTDFKGKTLWELLGNLKNLGVGRIVGRNMFQRYPEPCYIKIRKVEVLPNVTPANGIEQKRKVIALVEKTFRGFKSEKLVQLESSTYKKDYFLVPKHKEAEFCKKEVIRKERILANKMEYPPLLKEILLRQMKAKGESLTEPKMKLYYNEYGLKTYRVAKDNETPTEPEPVMGLGKTLAPRLFENIKN